MATPKKITNIWVWNAGTTTFTATDKVQGTVPFGSLALNIKAEDGFVIIDWADILDADSYDLEYDTSPLFDSPATQLNDVEAPYTLAATNDVPLYVRVRAVIDAVPQDWLTAVTATPAATGHDLWPHKARYPTIKRSLEALPEMRFVVFAGSAFHVGGLLRFRQRVFVVYDDGSWEGYRIHEVDDNVIICVSMLADLQDVQFRYVRAVSGEQTRILPLPRIRLDGATNDSAMDILFDPKNGIPPLFTQGSVASDLEDTFVRFNANYTTFWDLLVSFCQQAEEFEGLSCEIEPVMTGDPSDGTPAPSIAVHIVLQQGWTDDEKTAEEPDPTLRPIDVPNGGALSNYGNLVRQRRVIDQTQFASRIVPIGGDEANPVGFAGLKFKTTSVSYGGSDLSLVSFWAPVISFDDHWATPPPDGIYAYGLILHDDNPAVIPEVARILSTTAPLQATISDPGGGIAAAIGSGYAQLIAFTNSGFTEWFFVDFQEDPAAIAEAGLVERAVLFPEVGPYPNLISELLGLPGDMAFTGTPAGFSTSGGTVTDIDLGDTEGPLYISYGDRCKKLELDEGEYLRIGPMDLVGLLSKQSPHVSFWVAGRVESGRVRISLLDDDDVYHPDGEGKVEMVADQTAEFSLGGIEPLFGEVYLHFEALEDGTVFYLDAVTLTQSIGAWRFTYEMGGLWLYFAAAAFLEDQASQRQQYIDTEFIDLSQVESLLDQETEVRLGSWVRLRCDYQPSMGSYLTEVDARVVELVEEDGPDGRYLKKARLQIPPYGEATPYVIRSVGRPDFTRRALANPVAAEVPPAPLTTQRRTLPAQEITPIWKMFAPDVWSAHGSVSGGGYTISPLDKTTIGAARLFGVTGASAITGEMYLASSPSFVTIYGQDKLRWYTLLYPWYTDSVKTLLIIRRLQRFMSVQLAVRLMPDEDQETPTDVTILRWYWLDGDFMELRFKEIPSQGSFTSPDFPDNGSLIFTFRWWNDSLSTFTEFAEVELPSYYAFNATVDSDPVHFYATDVAIALTMEAYDDNHMRYALWVNGQRVASGSFSTILAPLGYFEFMEKHSGATDYVPGFGGGGIFDLEVFDDLLPEAQIVRFFERNLSGLTYDVELGGGSDPYVT